MTDDGALELRQNREAVVVMLELKDIRLALDFGCRRGGGLVLRLTSEDTPPECHKVVMEAVVPVLLIEELWAGVIGVLSEQL